MSRTELVIFDCDDVLVDSEPVANRTFEQMLRELGLDLTPKQMFENFVGYSIAHCMRVVEGMLAMRPRYFASELQAHVRRIQNGVTVDAGIEYAIETIGVPFCVASSGDHEKMRTTLGITGLLPRFEGRIFSVTQVARGKQASDVYLFAAEQLNANSTCVFANK